MTSKLKILMTTDVKSEIWDYSLTLSRSLLKHINAEILMLSMGGKPSDKQKEEIENLDIKFKFTGFNYDNFDDISEIKTIFDNSIKEFNPHIVHLNHAYPNFDFETPCVFTCHDNLLDKNLLNYKNIINKSLNNADIVIAQSKFTAECLMKTYDLQKRIGIIYNGIDYKPFSGSPESPTLVACENFPNSGQNINFLLNIAYKLPDNIKMKIIADSPPDRKSPQNVEFLSNLTGSELQAVYKNSSIYLALSSHESNGLSSIQAAYSGCAILANDIPVFKELWGDCAYVFERDNVNSLMRCINNLVENKYFFEITSRNCQAKALSVFNSKRMAYEYINLYKNILKKHQTTEKISQENLKTSK